MNGLSAVGTSQSMLLQQMRTGERPGGSRPQGPPPGMQQALESAAESAGLDSTQIAELTAQLDETAQVARENGQGPEAMKTAMDSVLEEAGIDVASFHETISSMMGPKQGHGGPSGGMSLLDSLDTDSSDSHLSLDLLEMLRSLPTGSLYDSEA